ncbi:MAG: flavin reductase family protein [Alicyclobacillus sp.]|nr:flavin reductase family protein [Alicyclobacillus sp.]
MPIESDAFRQVLGRFASGVTVVTATHNGVNSGLTVSAFCSLSLNPPYVLICVDKQSSTNPVIQASGAFAVNILADDQAHLSNHFARRDDDKFASLAFHRGALGLPILPDTVGHLECRLVHQLDGGDHFIYIGSPETSEVDPSKRPLLYFHGQYGAFSE